MPNRHFLRSDIFTVAMVYFFIFVSFALLGNWDGIPVTYAGGVSSFEDLRKLKELGKNKVDVTIGSALDLFGGKMPFSKVLEEIKY